MRALSGLNKLVGFGLSMAMLAIVALVAIPAMIRASGESAWGVIALGQNLGSVGAMIVSYGWGIAGPAEVAAGDRASRLVEFLSSVKVRLVLLVPTALVAVVPSVLLAPTRPDLAAVGAVTTILTGLTANWFFVGLARPYVLMLVETVPRVLFTVVGIIEMEQGADAVVGLAWQGGGLIAAFVMSAWWIRRYLDSPANQKVAIPKLSTLLRQHGHGVTSSVGGTLYGVFPLVIVTVVAPAAQPMFALLDKLLKQIFVALFPVISVLQGWVPQVEDPAPRAGKVMVWGAGISAAIAAGTTIFGGWMLHFLGAGTLTPPLVVTATMGVVLGLYFYVTILGHAVLATYGKMRALAKIGRAHV